jgi:hypothetical protein
MRHLAAVLAAGLIAASCASSSDGSAEHAVDTTAVESEGSTSGPASSEPPATEPPGNEPPATEPPVTEPPVTEPPATDTADPALEVEADEADPTTPPQEAEAPEESADGGFDPDQFRLPDNYLDYQSDVYADDAVWLCRAGAGAATPGGDICERDLDATAVFADGSIEARPHERASEPAADCFYVYPTTSQDETANSDFVPSEEAEIDTTLAQAARLTGACRVFAPMYRQITLAALFGQVETDESTRELAYSDVVDSFRHYMANDNGGRPFVLFGHSQGAGLLRRMIAEEIDTEPLLHEQMLSAILLGTSIGVDQFGSVPECTTTDDTNCLISYSSFRDTAPPQEGAFFGSFDGEPAVCVNPVDPSAEQAVSTPYFSLDARDGAISGAEAYDPGTEVPDITTPRVTYPDMVMVRSVDDGSFRYLELSITTDDGPRRDDIGGDLAPEWGMHLVGASIAMGNLVDVVQAQPDAFDS